MKYRIGKTISVLGDSVSVLLEDYSEDSGECRGVPEGMCIDIQNEEGPLSLIVGQPGSFVDVSIPTGSLICIVTAVKMTELAWTSGEVTEAGKDEEYLIDTSKRILEVIAIGTIKADGSFERGSDVLPTVGADVFAVSPDSIKNMYSSYSSGDFSIGTLSVLPGHAAMFNLDTFLSRHAAILGQTGCGKSWTVATILQRIAAFPQSTMLLLDLHGEYEDSFGDYATYLSASDLELPYWLMNSEELIDLCVDRAEAAAPNQIAKFRELLQDAKNAHPENVALGIPTITVDTPVYFDFETIIEEFERLDTEMVPGATPGKLKQGALFGQFSRLLMRLRSRMNDKRFNLIFRPTHYTTSASMEELFRRIMGEESAPKKLVILDLSPVPFEVRSSLISLILRCLFDFSYWHKRDTGNLYPVAIFADEAHVYLNDRDSRNESSRHSAERIAKEGRKYGVSLTVISQRPREISSTILSQCNSFLCLRISNPDDQSYVRNLLPDSMKGIVDIFSTLRRGEGILIGDSVLMPTRISITPPEPKPNSNDVLFTEIWGTGHSAVDVGSILDLWRRQGVAPKTAG